MIIRSRSRKQTQSFYHSPPSAMGRIKRRGPDAIPIIEKHKFRHLKVGSTVEVTTDEEGFQGAWYVAKIIKPSLNRNPNKLLIQYDTLVSEHDSDQPLTEMVEASFIRPPPPPPPFGQIYGVSDVVDAFHRDGWWKGVVSRVYARKYKRKLRKKYTVVFENPPEEFNFSGDLLRFHFDWVAGTWLRSPKHKVLPNGTQCEEEESENGEEKESASAPLEDEKESADIEESAHEELEEAESVHEELEEESAHEELEEEESEREELEEEESAHEQEESASEEEEEEEEEEEQQQQQQSLHASLKGSSISYIHGQEQSSVKNSRKNQLEQSTSPSTTSTSKKQKISAPEVEETFPNYSSKFRKENSSDLLSHDLTQQEAGSDNATTEALKNRERELDAQVMGQRVPAAAGEDGTNEDPAEVINEPKVETFNHSYTVNDQAEREPVSNNDQPFTRSSYIWKHIDSLEIFQTLPQKPHFSFLSDCNEETREGSAIGHMITFASMVEKVTKLQIDDPRSLFDRYLEALAILEEIGFDVKVVLDRLNELLALKTTQENLANQSKRYQSLVVEFDVKKVKLEQEDSALNKMSELAEQQTLKVPQILKEESKRDFLQLQISSIKKSMFDVEFEFKVKSSAPWQTTV